jgi:uncharacterized oligopeptide transporter (OPT) family protein
LYCRIPRDCCSLIKVIQEAIRDWQVVLPVVLTLLAGMLAAVFVMLWSLITGLVQASNSSFCGLPWLSWFTLRSVLSLDAGYPTGTLSLEFCSALRLSCSCF